MTAKDLAEKIYYGIGHDMSIPGQHKSIARIEFLISKALEIQTKEHQKLMNQQVHFETKLARNQALEEAAKMAESACHCHAVRIRALKDPVTEAEAYEKEKQRRIKALENLELPG